MKLKPTEKFNEQNPNLEYHTQNGKARLQVGHYLGVPDKNIYSEGYTNKTFRNKKRDSSTYHIYLKLENK